MSLGMRVQTSPALSRLFLASAPFAVLILWGVAGQWSLSGPEPRAWLLLVGLVAFASRVPLPGLPSKSRALRRFRGTFAFWGWLALAGLVVTS